ncbi:unnamed protein product [Ceutorhynchus assimilis]|uniref:Uncharacterized protein n=1 Tax=Ceutorhynchus assimilis TaxID=467358 RepID=A0A9N9MB72_9CUCU|nr:unnamed protein product [Ceutorhynchus assimilis]
MPKPYRDTNKVIVELILISLCVKIAQTCNNHVKDESALDRELKNYVDRVLKTESFSIIPGVDVEKLQNTSLAESESSCDSARSLETFEDYVQKKLDQYAQSHVVSVNFEQTARFLTSSGTGTSDSSGKGTFLAGFGMGILAFFLKKLMLPVIFGTQIIKSALIAMFLPTILGGIGKLAGKGLSTFSGLSAASTGYHRPQQQEMEDFEFKDAESYNNEEPLGANFNDGEDSLTLGTSDSSSTVSPNSRFDFANNRIYTAPKLSDNYYLRRPQKKTDYKVFHKIPSSSLLLTSYDPFYSPLLSRLDSVFQQLGLGNEKSSETERCRERLVCMMYANPAKYAPYSNLVSAQLSRELNELRKPSSDNPEILRFFRYMKAAKDGQDGEECLAHGGCPSLTANQPSPALLTTFNEINKLVQARKLQN